MNGTLLGGEERAAFSSAAPSLGACATRNDATSPRLIRAITGIQGGLIGSKNGHYCIAITFIDRQRHRDAVIWCAGWVDINVFGTLTILAIPTARHIASIHRRDSACGAPSSRGSGKRKATPSWLRGWRRR